MSRMLEVAGWAVAAGAIAAAAIAHHRRSTLADAAARACHELRGALTAARLGLTLALRAGQLADVRMRALELDLGRATLALEDLTQVGTREWSRAIVRGEEVDLAALLTESVEAWRGLADAHGAVLRLLEASGRSIVLGHRLRLAQAIGNLVANAVEHAGGLVDIGCRAGAATVRIEVTDTGPGLPAPLAELARRRRRAGRSRGHGLAIATAIASAHGGRLSAIPGDSGSKVVLELPSA